MTALEDRRPVAATTTTSAHPAVLGQGLVQLLLEHPGIELASIRLIPSTEHAGVGIAGRIGPLAEQTAEYHCCHQLIGRPHTDYCLNALPEVTVHPHVATCTAGPDCPTCDNPAGISYLRPVCSAPAADRGDGRGCQDDNCPRHGRPNEDTPCPRCDGCGQLANDDDRTPWTFWANLKPPANMAVKLGMVWAEPCDECDSTGVKATS